MAFNTSELRGRPVTQEEAATAVRRLINSHFHNPDSARVSIPARATDDDLVASDYVVESEERYAALQRDSVPRAVAEELVEALRSMCLRANHPKRSVRRDARIQACDALAAYERLGGVEEGK